MKTADMNTAGKYHARAKNSRGFEIEWKLTDGEERAGPILVLVGDGRAASKEVDGLRPVHHLLRLGRRRGTLGLGIHLRRARRGHQRVRQGDRLDDMEPQDCKDDAEVAGTLTQGRGLEKAGEGGGNEGKM